MILSSISRVLPFVIITILCIGGVELFYSVYFKQMLNLEYRSTAAYEPSAENGSAKALAQPGKNIDYSIITRRNLFGATATQSFDPLSKETISQLERTTLELALLGTIEGAKEEERAIIFDIKSGKQDIYRVGETILGATIKEILRTKIVLTYNGTDEILDMSETADYSSAVSSRTVAVAPSTKVNRTLPGITRPSTVNPASSLTRPVRSSKSVKVPTRYVGSSENTPSASQDDVKK